MKPLSPIKTSSAIEIGVPGVNEPLQDLEAVIGRVMKRAHAQFPLDVIGKEIRQKRQTSNPAAALRCGGILAEAGLYCHAEESYCAIVRSFPAHPGGYVGLAQVAMGRKSWTEALSLWDNVLQMFKDLRNAFWHAGRASVLLELGRSDEAGVALGELLNNYPDEPATYLGLAQFALRRHQWAEAVTRCDDILARFGDHAASMSCRGMRVTALLELGRVDEAEALANELASHAVGSINAFLLLLRVYARTGRPETALRALNASPFCEIEIPALVERRLDILVRLKRFEEGCAIFVNLIDRAHRPEVLTSLFVSVPALYQIDERRRIWIALLERTSAIERGLRAADLIPLGILRARIQLALRNSSRVIQVMRELTGHPHPDLGQHGESLSRIAMTLSEPHYPDRSRPKIFGIGLSKTGTTSLAAALTLLGFHTLHWLNPLTGEVISDDDLTLFDAFTDTPISVRFEDLYDQFPNSKFIFTTRPFDDWVKSIIEHWRRQLGLSDFNEIKSALTQASGVAYGEEYRQINHRLYFNFQSYREAFEAFETRVRQFFHDKPTDRFLDMNIFAGDGWRELCAFLGLNLPSTDFPWENRKPE